MLILRSGTDTLHTGHGTTTATTTTWVHTPCQMYGIIAVCTDIFQMAVGQYAHGWSSACWSHTVTLQGHHHHHHQKMLYPTCD